MSRRYQMNQDDEQRAALALQLRSKRLTYEQIAARLGYNGRQSCHRAVQRLLDRSITSTIEELRAEELAVLDALQGQVMAVVFDPKKSVSARLRGVERVLAIIDKRAKLMGLYVNPERSEVRVKVVVREVSDTENRPG